MGNLTGNKKKIYKNSQNDKIKGKTLEHVETKKATQGKITIQLEKINEKVLAKKKKKKKKKKKRKVKKISRKGKAIQTK